MIEQKSKEVKVFKSLKKPDTYLFVSKSQKFEELPSELLDSFGHHELVIEIELSPKRILARADATQVLSAIESRGFYLQLPPTIDELSNG